MPADLTADEAAVYDRQLRVWGLETQQRLRNSKVLIVGCTGLAAEIAKNVVLAGVGSVTLVDDTPCSAAAPGNFLVPHDAKDQTVAEACVATLKEMNPLVSVIAAPGTAATHLADTAQAAGNNIVILVGQSGAAVAAADAACTAAGVPFVAACSRGPAGWAFANLYTHEYIVENKTEQKDGTTKTTTQQQRLEGVSWEGALAAAMAKRSIKRLGPMLPILRVCSRFEMENGRAVSSDDLEDLQVAVEMLYTEEGLYADGEVAEALAALTVFVEHVRWALASYVEHAEEMPAINAIVGGVVSNDVIKIVAAKGEPMVNNLFFYSLADGAGWVERLGPAAA